MSSVAINQELLAAAVGRLGKDTLTGVRMAALSSFGDSGFPGIRHENWRYTNLAPAAELSNAWLGAEPRPAPSTDIDIDKLSTAIDAHWLVISNGVVNPDSLATLQSAGVSATPLSKNADTIQIDIEAPLSSFNASLMHDGVLIRIADNQTLEKPLGLLFLDDATQTPGLSLNRCLIELGQNARASFVELHRSMGQCGHLANSVMQLELAAGASASFVRVQERQKEHLQIGRVLATLQDNATFRHTSIDVGGSLTRNDIVVTMAGKNSVADICGAFLADDTQHMDNHILVDHKIGPARSLQDFRGIVGGRSRCVFNGKALVREGADGTDAEQSNHNLLLSDTAEIDTKPELEIFADDVKCSHGTTVGQLDEKALFYLRSRGLSHKEATNLLTRAFVGHILQQLPIERVKTYVDNIVTAKLDQMTGAAG